MVPIEVFLKKFLKKVWSFFNENNSRKYWTAIFNNMKLAKIDTWDKQITVLANTNIIKNIGFDEDTTHTILERKLANS